MEIRDVTDFDEIYRGSEATLKLNLEQSEQAAIAFLNRIVSDQEITDVDYGNVRFYFTQVLEEIAIHQRLNSVAKQSLEITKAKIGK